MTGGWWRVSGMHNGDMRSMTHGSQTAHGQIGWSQTKWGRQIAGIDGLRV